MSGDPDIDAFIEAFKAEIVKNNDLDKETGSNFVADGGVISQRRSGDLFERVFVRLAAPRA
jgi:hypothetical protein